MPLRVEGIVTSVSVVERFLTGIKMEASINVLSKSQSRDRPGAFYFTRN